MFIGERLSFAVLVALVAGLVFATYGEGFNSGVFKNKNGDCWFLKR